MNPIEMKRKIDRLQWEFVRVYGDKLPEPRNDRRMRKD